MIRGNQAHVGLAAVVRGGHGPREILTVNQVAGYASGLIGTDTAVSGRHIHHDFAFLQKRRAEGGVFGPGKRPVHREQAFQAAGDAGHVLTLG